MKTFNKILILIACILPLNSCLGDLNTVPLNETDFTSENAYSDEANYLKALAYINGYYMLVGQSDPGANDLGFSDSGQSELLRQWSNLNELSADGLKCVWGDSYISDISYHLWGSGTNDAITCVYTRAIKGITLVNEFLLQTTNEKLDGRGQGSIKETIAGYRAEARFHRAMFFYILMDEFGNPPFPTPENIGGANPERIERAQLFNWLEEELLDLANGNDMPEKGEVPYPRPTKGSVWGLLSRMYLNAEVYTGTARWQDAKNASSKVIEMGYSIVDKYSDLFAQDNSTNGAENEFVFAVAYDAESTQSWGGTTTLTSASLGEDVNKKLAEALGVNNSEKINYENWAGYHFPDEYVAFFELQDIVWGTDDAFGFNRERSDKRAMFSNYGCTKEFDMASQASGWYCWKFNGLKSDGQCAQTNELSLNPKLSSADFPVIRLAEMYLNYAEADARLNGGEVSDSKAKGYIEEIRNRAGKSTPSVIDLDFLLAERAREFTWEGHRRVDLIRFGKFTSMDFPWPFKGGVANGKVAIPEYKTIYPIVQSDLSSNSNLKQNPGY